MRYVVENLPLINAVVLDIEGGPTFLWCDGDWTISTNGDTVRAPLPEASSMEEARRIGRAWLSRHRWGVRER